MLLRHVPPGLRYSWELRMVVLVPSTSASLSSTFVSKTLSLSLSLSLIHTTTKVWIYVSVYCVFSIFCIPDAVCLFFLTGVADFSIIVGTLSYNIKHLEDAMNKN